MIADAPVKLGEPALRWSARAHSIAEIESELARIWASQDLTTDMDGEPGRHVAARTSVMNLVVVARRPELAERCAATIQALTGRHPSRTIVIQSADPDGPSWLDARVEAHCVLPREDAPETCAETIHLTCGGESGAPPGRHRDAADHPRPAGHGLVAGRAAAHLAGRPGPVRDRRPARGRRVHLERRRTGQAARAGGAAGVVAPGHQRLRARPPVALARGHRVDLRRPGLPALPALAPSHRGHLRDARRDLCAGIGEPGQAALPRRLDRLATRPVGRQAAGRRAPVTAPRAVDAVAARPGPGRPASGKPVTGRGFAATLSDGRADVAVLARPIVSTMPSGTTLRVELLADRRGLRAAGRCDRRGRDRPRPGLAGRRGSLGPAASGRRDGPTSTCWPRRSRPAARDPVAVGALRSAAALVGDRQES